MGCIPSKIKTKSFARDQISKLEDLKIDPGTFVTSNPKSFQEVYTIGKIISTSTSGEIRKVTHRTTSEERSVKIFRKDLQKSKKYDQLINEIQILKKVNHPNIIKIFEFFEESQKLFIVTERCEGGELFEEILKRKKFSEEQTVGIVWQLLSVIAYLHEQGIVHRDLKPENILLEEKGDFMNIRLSDFGAATYIFKDDLLRGASGTAYYIAPEVLGGEYNELCDLWSLGVIVYILLSGYPPFDGDSDSKIFEKVKLGEFDLNSDPWPSISEPAKDLIRKLLSPVGSRISAAEALGHEWVTSFSFPIELSDTKVYEVLENLRNFHNSNKLKDAVRTFITTQCLSLQDTKELRKVFRTIDANNDGKLSRSELIKHYEKVMGTDHAEEEVEKIMAQVDSDNNGFIDYSEFIKASVSQRVLMSSENLRRAFDMFDKDRSGTISADELKKVLGSGLDSEDNIWEQIIRSVDQNCDSVIDLMEFEEIIMSNFE